MTGAMEAKTIYLKNMETIMIKFLLSWLENIMKINVIKNLKTYQHKKIKNAN